MRTDIQHCLISYNAEFASEGFDLFPRLSCIPPGLRLSQQHGSLVEEGFIGQYIVTGGARGGAFG